MMRRILLFLFVLSCFQGFTQTITVNINAKFVLYNDLYQKAYVAVKEEDENYPKNMVQLDPFSGVVEKSLLLSAVPQKFELTPDKKSLYISYKLLHKIDKVNLDSFEITETIQTDNQPVSDFTVSPLDEDILFVILKDEKFGEKMIMIKNGVVQPRQVQYLFDFEPSSVCVKSDGTKLYGHNGISTGFDGYLLDVVDDGLVWDSIDWDYMLASFGRIKTHNDLVFGRSGMVVDPFSDTLPLRVARFPLYLFYDFTAKAFEFSTFHNCYIFANTDDKKEYNGYIHFFSSEYYNYVGSLKVFNKVENIYDVDVVDANHFILVYQKLQGEYVNAIDLFTVDSGEKNEINEDGTANKNWFKKLTKLTPEKPNKNDPMNEMFFYQKKQ